MKMFKWSLLIVVLVAVMGFASITPCIASDIQSDEAVMTDEDPAYDSEQYNEPDTADETYNEEGNADEEGDTYAEGDTYEEPEYQEEGGEYVDEPEGESAQDE